MFWLLLIVYALVRALSFFLIEHTLASGIIATVIVLAFSWMCWKDISLGWKLLVLELLLDGAGHFFELGGLLLRTWLLGAFAIVWLIQKNRARAFPLPNKRLLAVLCVFTIVCIGAIVNGAVRGNSPLYIAQDVILYLFITLLFPALDSDIHWQPLYDSAFKVFIIGSAIFSALTLALYSSGQFVLQDRYYHWFRDIAAGKITDLGSHFFRVVNAEHILFVPIILVLIALLIKNSHDKKLWGLLAAALFVITINFTRIYFLALAVGAVLLFSRTHWRVWFKTCGLTIVLALVIFLGTHLVASRGTSLGLELIGIRVGGAVAPTDPSAAIRRALLPDIKAHIAGRPLIGSGLGTEISYSDPATGEIITRTQFDWGYFEMITELGAVGTLAFLALLVLIIRQFTTAHPHERGLTAGAWSFFITNITTPALFQGFGVLFFAYLAARSNKNRDPS